MRLASTMERRVLDLANAHKLLYIPCNGYAPMPILARFKVNYQGN